jgi:hypothetical protein
MNPPPWYVDWAARHATAFMLPLDWQRAAFLYWPIFEQRHANREELDSGTREMQSVAPRKKDGGDFYPGDHLPWLVRYIGGVRNKAVAKARMEYESTHGVCTECGDSGAILIPHPKHCRAGVWEMSHYHRRGHKVWVTSTAACRCWIGRRAVDSARARQTAVPLSIEQFEAHVCPDWKRQMAAVQEEQEAETSTARRADAALGDVRRMVEGLAGGMRR